MGTKAYSVHPNVAQGIICGSTSYPEYLGASPIIKFYSGTVPPGGAKDALGSAVLLATMTAAATPIAATGADTGSNAWRATWNTIPSVTVSASGTCTFYRTYKSDGTTVVDQGNVDVSGADINFSTVAFTVGSTLSLSAKTNDFPYGP